MKKSDIKKKLNLVSMLTGMKISKESMVTAINNFKDKTEEEFLSYVPMFIHEANIARKIMKDKNKEEVRKSKIITSN